MLKFEDIASVGDVIKAMDFEGIDTEYLIGEVIAKGDILHPVYGNLLYRGYTVRIIGQGESNGYDIGEEAYVPFETSFDYDNRVSLVLLKEELDLLVEAA